MKSGNVVPLGSVPPSMVSQAPAAATRSAMMRATTSSPVNMTAGLGGAAGTTEATVTTTSSTVVQNPITGPVPPTGITFTPGTGSGVAFVRPRTGTPVPSSPTHVVSGNSGPGGVIDSPVSTLGIVGSPQIGAIANPPTAAEMAEVAMQGPGGQGSLAPGLVNPLLPVVSPNPNATTQNTGLVGTTGTGVAQATAPGRRCSVYQVAGPRRRPQILTSAPRLPRPPTRQRDVAYFGHDHHHDDLLRHGDRGDPQPGHRLPELSV